MATDVFFSWSGLKRSLDVVGARPAEASGRLALSWGASTAAHSRKSWPLRLYISPSCGALRLTLEGAMGLEQKRQQRGARAVLGITM